MPVGRLDLTALVLDLTEQPCVLNRQGGLSRKRLKQVHDFGFKISRLLPPNGETAHDLLFAEKRDRQERSIPESRKHRPHPGAAVFSLIQDVRHLDRLASRYRLSRNAFTQAYR